MHRERYNDVIRICCLEKDLELMENGDQTEIGERGINLSGGQNQRIQLARAVYQDCEIYILDDVFSAIDAQTASKIFKECIRGALKNKTIVLVTDQVDFLHDADTIFVSWLPHIVFAKEDADFSKHRIGLTVGSQLPIFPVFPTYIFIESSIMTVMKGGIIVQSGTYNELLQQGSDFAVLVAAHDSSMEHVESSLLVEENREDLVPLSCHPSTSGRTSNDDIASMMEPKAEETSGQLIKEEQRERGHVSHDIYKKYITEAWGWWGPLLALLSLAWQGPDSHQ